MKVFNLHIFTVGHSNHNADSFIQLLNKHGIECIVDVRSSPYSRYNKIFNQQEFQKLLAEKDIDYKWMGDALGGRRENLTSELGFRKDNEYDNDPVYIEGVINLMRLGLRKLCCVMCSEEEPRDCHRHKIIANTLINRKINECNKLNDITVSHIRADGLIEDAKDIPIHFQLNLF